MEHRVTAFPLGTVDRLFHVVAWGGYSVETQLVKKRWCWAWWYISVILAVRRLKLEDLSI